MTPEERKLVTDLFDRLATVEDAQRDPEAERLMKDGLRQAPNALYALVQTVLVQDEALKRADGRIRELEQTLDDIDQQQQPPPRDTSFLGGVRDSLLGRRGSVPSVPANEAGPGMSQTSGSGTQGPGMSQAWRTGAPTGGPGMGGPGYAPPPPPGYGGGPGYGGAPMGQGGMPMAQGGMQGGSFLGNAAAAAAGAIGGSLLMNGIRGLMGHQGGTAHAAADPSGGLGGSAAGAAPGGGSAAGSDLSRQAGAGDVGRPHSQVNDSHASDADNQRLADQDQDDDQDADEDDDYDDDDGGDDSDE
jgi:hypothetical protein